VVARARARVRVTARARASRTRGGGLRSPPPPSRPPLHGLLGLWIRCAESNTERLSGVDAFGPLG
jgi:hypothetical protein